MSIKTKRSLLAVAFIIIALYGLFKLVENIVMNRLEKFLEEKPLSGHIVTYDKGRLKVFPPGIRMVGFQVVPDSAGAADSDTAAMDFQLRTKKFNLSVRGVKIIRYLREDILSISTVELVEPRVYVHFLKESERDSTQRKEQDEAKNKLRKIELGKLNIKGGGLRYIDRGENGMQVNLEGIRLLLEEIGLDLEEKPVFSLREAMISFTSSGMILPGSMYSLQTSGFSFDSREGNFITDSVVLDPLYDKYEFARKAAYQTDRFDIDILRISGEGIVFDSLISNSVLRMKSFLVESPEADIYRDKNIPRDPDFFPPLPHNALMNLGFGISLDSLHISNGYVRYGELAEGHEEAGDVFLEGLDVDVTRISNIVTGQMDSEFMVLRGTGMLMGSGRLHIKLEFPLRSEPVGFEFSGELEPFDLGNLNSMTAPNMGMSIESGRTSYIAFNSVAGVNSSDGRIRMHYENLKLSLLKKYTGNQKDKNMFTRFESSVANRLIHKENPKKGKERIGKMHFERDQQKSFLNYMVKTLMSGMLAIVTPGNNNVIIEKEED